MKKTRSCYIVFCITTFVCIIALQTQAQDFGKSIEEIWDFVNNSEENVTVETLDRQPLQFGAEFVDERGAMKLSTTIDSGVKQIGTVPADAIHLQAKANDSGAKYGVVTQRVLQIPKDGYTQFQGGAAVIDGIGDQTDLVVLVETRNDPQSSWELAKTSTGNKRNRENADTRKFIVDLTPWAGQEIRLSIGVQAQPKLLTVGNVQKDFPDTISANWYLAEVVNSTFRVIVGNPKPATELNHSFQFKSSNSADTSSARIASTTFIPSTTDIELVIEGSGVEEGLQNPSDAPLASVYVPAGGSESNRYVSYFTSRLTSAYEPAHGDNPDDYGASTRMIDFGDNTNNMYDATPAEVTAAIVLNGTGTALNILKPSRDYTRHFDDHYTGITSAIASTLDDVNDTPVVHAFVHCEDHFQDVSSVPDHNDGGTAYIRIGYARSISGVNTPYAVDFDMTSPDDSLPIITYQYNENHSFYPDFDNWGKASVGVACPSVFELQNDDGYYYMVYTTYSIVLDAMGNPYPSGNPGQVGMFSAARALKSAVNDPDFDNNDNPWKKFSESNVSDWDHSSNWASDGVGGYFSGLWNAKTVSGLRTDQRDSNEWRAFMKVSYNSYIDKYVAICKGKVSTNNVGMFIHTSDDPVNWDDGLLIPDSEELAASENFQFPSLVGSGGTDSETGQFNKLYFYVKDEVSPSQPKGLWRLDLEFQN